jgi:hypothetical protein
MDDLTYLWHAGWVLTIFAGIYVGHQTEQRKKAAWRQFAQTNGLTFVPSRFLGPSCYVTGNYQGCSLVLNRVERGSGKSKKFYTCLQLTTPSYQRIELPLAQFPLGQSLTVKAVEDLFTSKLPSRLKGEIVIKNKGLEWRYEQVETEEKYLQELTDWLVQLIKNYPKVLAFGGEAVTALHTITKTKDHALCHVAHQLLHKIADGTASRLKLHAHRLFCPHCLTGCTEHKLNLGWWQSLIYYGCRTCGQSREFLKVPLVAVLDRQMEAEQAESQAELRVNWLRRRNLYDFGRVEIIEATDEDVERFAVQVGNDTDEWRKPRYEQMSCVVSAQCQLSANTLRILERMFGEVKVETSPSPKIV